MGGSKGKTALGVEGFCQRAWESLYWMNINSDIREYIAKCLTCQKYEMTMNLFIFDGRDNFCTVDYLSNFWKIDHIHSTDTKMMITKLKHHFTRYSILDQVVTDNGTRSLMCLWGSGVLHTISLYNSKPNGKVVRMVKNLFWNYKFVQEDSYLAMLEHQNKPTKAYVKEDKTSSTEHKRPSKARNTQKYKTDIYWRR